jgi:phosphotransferase system enzyme I (PtsI)
MAGDPLCVPMLLGLGIKELSINVRAIPLVKKIIRAISLEGARADFENFIKFGTANEVRAYMADRMKCLFPELEGKGSLEA